MHLSLTSFSHFVATISQSEWTLPLPRKKSARGWQSKVWWHGLARDSHGGHKEDIFPFFPLFWQQISLLCSYHIYLFCMESWRQGWWQCVRFPNPLASGHTDTCQLGNPSRWHRLAMDSHGGHKEDVSLLLTLLAALFCALLNKKKPLPLCCALFYAFFFVFVKEIWQIKG